MAIGPEGIGGRIRAERKSAGVSIARLAELTGLSRTYLVRLENDPSSNPSLDVLHRIAQALDLTLAELLGRPAVRADHGEDDISPSLRDFAHEEGLTQRDIKMLASIKWRHGEEPRSSRRWRYVLESLRASQGLDESS